MESDVALSSEVVQSGDQAQARLPTDFVPLADETRTHVSTESAAFHLNREAQTLRVWACLQSGPIQPVRINGRLAWPIDSIRRLLGLTK